MAMERLKCLCSNDQTAHNRTRRRSLKVDLESGNISRQQQQHSPIHPLSMETLRYRPWIENAIDLLDENQYMCAFADRYDLEGMYDEATLVESLVQNRHGKSLWLDIQGVRCHGWKQACAILLVQDDLESVVIRGRASNKVERQAADAFLHACQHNPNVKAMDLRSISGATLPAYIQSSISSSLLTLALGEVTFPQEMKVAFPVALGRNTTIRRLVLRKLNQPLTIEILNNLAMNTTLTELVFTCRHMNRAVVLACGRLLAVTKTIQQFELRGIDIHRFRPLADAITASSSITCVILRDCQLGQPDVPRTAFSDQYSIYNREEDRAFNDILLSKDNITRLALCNMIGQPKRPAIFFQGISRLLQPGSTLRTLEMQFFSFSEGLGGHQVRCQWGSLRTGDELGKDVLENLATFWTTVKNSPLQHLSVANIRCKGELKSILQAIPQLKLSSLVVCVDKFVECGRTLQVPTQQWAPTRTLRTQFLAAIEKNGSLRKVEVQQNLGKNWFDQAEQDRLDSHLQIKVTCQRDYTPYPGMDYISYAERCQNVVV